MSMHVYEASPSCDGNLSTAGDCYWSQRPNNATSSFWLANGPDARARITQPLLDDVAAPAAAGDEPLQYDTEEPPAAASARRKEAGPGRASYKHVPHKERPPLIVARRNARERRRVQAVNSAFMRLRKAVPIISSRGKRVSKVKTLQTAIDYISGLQTLLKQADIYHDLDIITNFRYQDDFVEVFQHYCSDF